MLRFLLPIAQLLGVFCLLSCLPSCGVVRAAWFVLPDTNDYRHDPFRIIEPAEEPFSFFSADETENLGQRLVVSYRFVQNNLSLDDFVKLHHTQAFLIIRNDTLLYARYPDGNTPETLVTTFSVSKSIMATLTGIALQKGYLTGVDQPVGEILPEWSDRGFSDLTIQDLLQHTSGMSFSKSLFNLNSDQVQYYYGRNLRKRLNRHKPLEEPGKRIDYQSANTMLLGMVLEKATGKTLSRFLEEELWQPLGMSAPAFWSLDRKDEQAVERAFCCLQAQAEDFAKLGRLWLRDGNWEGQRIYAPGWVENLLQDRRSDSSIYSGGFSILGSACDKGFFASGLMGQYIFVIPEKNLILVRFGQHRKGYSTNVWRDIFIQLAEQL